MVRTVQAIAAAQEQALQDDQEQARQLSRAEELVELYRVAQPEGALREPVEELRHLVRQRSGPSQVQAHADALTRALAGQAGLVSRAPPLPLPPAVSSSSSSSWSSVPSTAAGSAPAASSAPPPASMAPPRAAQVPASSRSATATAAPEVQPERPASPWLPLALVAGALGLLWAVVRRR